MWATRVQLGELSAAWVLGYPDQAARRSEEALTLARELAHPHTTVGAHYWAASVCYQRGEVCVATERADVAAGLASALGFSPFLDYASSLLGVLRLERGEGGDVLAQIEHALASVRAAGWRWWMVWPLGHLGYVENGLAMLAEMSAQTQTLQTQSFYDAELHRLKGELLLYVADADHSEAEAAFRRAAEVARASQQKSLELRAVTGLAHLLDRQGKRAEARRMLGDVYGWFTEGFDTADLRQARILLDELSTA